MWRRCDLGRWRRSGCLNGHWRQCGGCQRLRPDQFDLDARLNGRRKAADRSDGEQKADQEVEAERDWETGFANDASSGAGTLHARIN